MDRRAFTRVLAAAGVAGLAPRCLAEGRLRGVGEGMPPLESACDFVAWAVTRRGERPDVLRRRFDSHRRMLGEMAAFDARNRRAFLLTPRERFLPEADESRAYVHGFLDIGYGVTAHSPHLTARMIQAIDVQQGDRVLEVGTGSGYQSAYLANLADKVWTIEIVAPLAARAARIRRALVAAGHGEYEAIAWKAGDGYRGWPEAAPFDKILVACGINHVPPPLLQQLSDGGAMVIPLGPPGAQRIVKIVRRRGLFGAVATACEDVYDGRLVPFVPFAGRGGGAQSARLR